MNDSEWLRTARAELGLSQAGLAEALGITQASVSQMESGVRPVTRRTRGQVTMLLDRDRGELTER